MPTDTLSCGPVQSMIQSLAYALPPCRCFFYTEAGAATFQLSNTQAFTVNTSLTLDANKQVEVAGGFIRLSSGGPVNVVLKRA